MSGIYSSKGDTAISLQSEGIPIMQITKGSFGANNVEPLKNIQQYISQYPSKATNTEMVDFPYLDENGELKYKPVSIYVVDVGK